MTTYSYKWVKIEGWPHDSVVYHGAVVRTVAWNPSEDDLDRLWTEGKLNEMGAAGWRLVHVLPEEQQSTAGFRWVLMERAEVPEPPPEWVRRIMEGMGRPRSPVRE